MLVDRQRRRCIEVERVLHLAGRVVLRNEQRVHVPACRLHVIVNQFAEAHLEENRADALDERLHRMRASHARRGGRQGHVEATEFGRLPRLTLLQQLRRDFSDGRLLLQKGLVKTHQGRKGRPRAVHTRFHLDEAATATEVLDHGSVR